MSMIVRIVVLWIGTMIAYHQPVRSRQGPKGQQYRHKGKSHLIQVHGSRKGFHLEGDRTEFLTVGTEAMGSSYASVTVIPTTRIRIRTSTSTILILLVVRRRIVRMMMMKQGVLTTTAGHPHRTDDQLGGT